MEAESARAFEGFDEVTDDGGTERGSYIGYVVDIGEEQATVPSDCTLWRPMHIIISPNG